VDGVIDELGRGVGVRGKIRKDGGVWSVGEKVIYVNRGWLL